MYITVQRKCILFKESILELIGEIMEVYFYSEEKGISENYGGKEEKSFGTAICLGGFDGIHKGHKALFLEAEKHKKWGVLIFDRNIKGSEDLTTNEEKITIIEKCGADFVVIAEFSDGFSKRTPEEFVDFLENTLKVSHIICGYDYRFGYKASGDVEKLKELCKTAEVSVISAVKTGDTPIKSTLLKELVKNGEIEKVNELLGHPYLITGIVEKGLGNGSKMGIPTANVSYSDSKILPGDGVYYGSVKGMDAVINIGKNPTFDAEKRTVEAHIPGFSGDLYGQKITVEFYEKIRDDIKFDSVDDLILQINNDIEYVKGKN